jgi:chromosome segregation ATPase
MTIVLVLAIGGLVTWNILQTKKYDQELKAKQEQIEEVQKDLTLSDELINALNDELEATQNQSAAERARVQKKLEAAQAEREELLQNAQTLRNELINAADIALQAGHNVDDAQSKIQELEEKLRAAEAKEAEKVAEEAKKAEKALKIYAEEDQAPVLDKKKEKVLKKY